MTKLVSRRERDIGFDVEIVRGNLLAELVKCGEITSDEFARRLKRWRSPMDIAKNRKAMLERGDDPKLVDELERHWQRENDRRAAASDADADWAVTSDIAHLHLDRHARRGPVDGRPCTAWPCRKLGVSVALVELCIYNAELSSPVLEAADELSERARDLRRVDRAGSKAKGLLAERQRDHEEWAQRVRLKPAPWKEGSEALDGPGKLAKHYEDLAKRMREQVLSREHRVYHPGMPGRRHQWLLQAVSKNLAEAGVTFDEIATLIPDNNPGTTMAERVERVRKRPKSEKCLTLRLEPGE